MSLSLNPVSAPMTDQLLASEKTQDSNPPSDLSVSKKPKTMDFQGFLKIMAAQMQNQSLTSGSGTDNSQYITEMALFTAVQAMNTQTSEANKQYAASLVGSNVSVETYNPASQKKEDVQGIVTRALFNSSGDAGVQIGNKVYSISDVMDVDSSGGDMQTAAYMVNARQYAISLVGKKVVVDTTDKDGKEQKVTGVVQNVSFDPSTDAATLNIDGKSYGAGLVCQVLGSGDASASGEQGTKQA